MGNIHVVNDKQKSDAFSSEKYFDKETVGPRMVEKVEGGVTKRSWYSFTKPYLETKLDETCMRQAHGTYSRGRLGLVSTANESWLQTVECLSTQKIQTKI